MADIDIESEKYRWMGSARLDFYVSSPFYNFCMFINDVFLSLICVSLLWIIVAIIFYSLGLMEGK